MSDVTAASQAKRHLLSALDDWPNDPTLSSAYTRALSVVDDLDRWLDQRTDALHPRVSERPEPCHPAD